MATMLSQSIQKQLAGRYATGTVKLAFDKLILENLQAAFVGNKKIASAAIFVDIAGFSRTVEGLEPSAVGSFLDDYYKKILPIIFEHCGMIDRIAGDGVVAIFSTAFGISTVALAENLALRAAEAVVSGVHGTDFGAKAAVSTGTLLFCKTGVAEIYQEFTVIGAPLTELYRLENEASLDEVLLRADSPLGNRVLAEIQRETLRRIIDPKPAAAQWSVAKDQISLRGVNGDRAVAVLREKLVT